MASGASLDTPNLDLLQALVVSPAASKVLPQLVWAATVEEETIRILAHLVRCRSFGFMVVLPSTEEVSSALESQVVGGQHIEIAFKQVTLALEDARGRKFGSGTVMLADVPVELLTQFTRVSSLRGAAALGLIRIKVGETIARPAARAAWEASDAWIQDVGESDEGILEYVTGESGLDGLPLDPGEGEVPNGPSAVEAGSADVINQLLSRIGDLEKALQQPPPLVHPSVASVGEPKPRGVAATTLFGASGQEPQLDGPMLAKLRSLAGPPPSRLGRFEKDAGRGHPSVAQNLHAEADAGVIDEAELAAVAGQSSDPIHRLLALQMQQTAMLAQRLGPRSATDRITAALGNESGQSSNGVKGCVARDAYLKTMEDIPATGRLIMANAASDLGLQMDQVGSGLMREYVERRMPIGEHRLLAHLCHFMAVSWQLSYEADDELAMGLMARGLMMLEQVAIDQGRIQFAWLLAAMPDPNLQTIALNKKRVGLRPYAKLACAPWVAGNIAFLKDLDFLENRLKGNKTTKDEEQQEESTNKTKWKKKKKGQKEEPGESSTA